jgi:hypothetical protein
VDEVDEPAVVVVVVLALDFPPVVVLVVVEAPPLDAVVLVELAPGAAVVLVELPPAGGREYAPPSDVPDLPDPEAPTVR